MWIFLTDAFLSIVAHSDLPDHLLVRARGKDDIGRAFPYADVTLDPSADYPYRATIPREVVGATLAAQAGAITATNFKSAVKDGPRHDAYLKVWGAMSEWGQTL